jgi:hypothetical protein
VRAARVLYTAHYLLASRRPLDAAALFEAAEGRLIAAADEAEGAVPPPPSSAAAVGGASGSESGSWAVMPLGGAALAARMRSLAAQAAAFRCASLVSHGACKGQESALPHLLPVRRKQVPTTGGAMSKAGLNTELARLIYSGDAYDQLRSCVAL